MGRFVKFTIKLPLTTYHLPLLFLLVFSGCASLQMPEYISRVDHPYSRKFYAGFEKVTSGFIYVLKKKGWTISEADPSIYENDYRYDNNGYRNLLIITDVKKHFYVFYSSFSHLNIFIHAIGDTCDVEIRYEAQTPLIKRFISLRNDWIAESIFDAVQQEVNR